MDLARVHFGPTRSFHARWICIKVGAVGAVTAAVAGVVVAGVEAGAAGGAVAVLIDDNSVAVGVVVIGAAVTAATLGAVTVGAVISWALLEFEFFRFQAALFTRREAIESTVVLLFKVTVQNMID